MKLKKKMDSENNRRYWEYVEQTSKEVEETYPAWKRGGEKINSRVSHDDSQCASGGVNDSGNGNGFHFS
jgi:hypothetical protein